MEKPFICYYGLLPEGDVRPYTLRFAILTDTEDSLKNEVRKSAVLDFQRAKEILFDKKVNEIDKSIYAHNLLRGLKSHVVVAEYEAAFLLETKCFTVLDCLPLEEGEKNKFLSDLESYDKKYRELLSRYEEREKEKGNSKESEEV